MTVLPQEKDLLWGQWSRVRFVGLASEDFGWRPTECTGDKLKWNYSKLLFEEKGQHCPSTDTRKQMSHWRRQVVDLIQVFHIPEVIEVISDERNRLVLKHQLITLKQWLKILGLLHGVPRAVNIIQPNLCFIFHTQK